MSIYNLRFRMKFFINSLLLIVTLTSAKSQTLFDADKRWILVSNKIGRNEIELQQYNSAKVDINTLVMSFKPNGMIEYDYESSDDVDACLGVDFLDIDTDFSRWEFDSTRNVLTLTIKGGYASLDDFKFKREYDLWFNTNGNYVLRKSKEHYFVDLQRQNKRTKIR